MRAFAPACTPMPTEPCEASATSRSPSISNVAFRIGLAPGDGGLVGSPLTSSFSEPFVPDQRGMSDLLMFSVGTELLGGPRWSEVRAHDSTAHFRCAGRDERIGTLMYCGCCR